MPTNPLQAVVNRTAAEAAAAAAAPCDAEVLIDQVRCMSSMLMVAAVGVLAGCAHVPLNKQSANRLNLLMLPPSPRLLAGHTPPCKRCTGTACPTEEFAGAQQPTETGDSMLIYMIAAGRQDHHHMHSPALYVTHVG
jgi:hypothetical protein